MMSFNMILLRLLLFTSVVLGLSCGAFLPVKPTRGEVVPYPRWITKNEDFFNVNPSSLEFRITGNSCAILDEALVRYRKLLKESLSSENIAGHRLHIPGSLGKLESVDVYMREPCGDKDVPTTEFTDEYYYIALVPNRREIGSNKVWGMLRALETFSQLIYKDELTSTWIINSTNIGDRPRFPHRGLMLDTSRHFIPVKYILKTLDAMSYNKLNVFHWHIVDDQSFPYKSRTYPELSENGAYHPFEAVYQPEDVEQIIEYARKRGIRVIVEFDTPGHTLSWGRGVKDILTKCVGLSDEYGPMNPSLPAVYEFLSKFFKEISEVFPEKYIHLGGDEVAFDCWRSNPNITDFMKTLNITGNYAALESYFIEKLIDIVDSEGLNPIVWQEVFDNGVNLPNKTVVHVWKEGYKDELSAVTAAGHPVLLSSCWNLDHLGGLRDWEDFYQCEPYDFPANWEQLNQVLGGEVCMWSEAVNENNLMSRIWPRAAAAAEILWSPIGYGIDHMRSRLEEHTCRLNRRNIEAKPANGPSFCSQ